MHLLLEIVNLHSAGTWLVGSTASLHGKHCTHCAWRKQEQCSSSEDFKVTICDSCLVQHVHFKYCRCFPYCLYKTFCHISLAFIWLTYHVVNISCLILIVVFFDAFSGMHIKMLMPACDEAKRLIHWVESGVTDALKKGYLKSLFYGISRNKEGTELLEVGCVAICLTNPFEGIRPDCITQKLAWLHVLKKKKKKLAW